LAGFWIRFAGLLLDSLLYGLLATALFVPGTVLLVQAWDDCYTLTTGTEGRFGDSELICPPGAPDAGMIALGIALMLAGLGLVFVLYFRALGHRGQTWGARIVGVKVIGESTGEPLGIGKAIGRQLFAWYISAPIFYLGYLWAAWDDRTQTWQDKIIKSVVIKV
jgi:uncharacterized RDD family membrane protein YckC